MGQQESAQESSEVDQDAASTRLAERILEDASLTADLTDQAAQVLLDWGVAQARTLAHDGDPNTGLASLRQRMRRLSTEAGKAAPEDQVSCVQALLADAEQAERDPESQSHEGVRADLHPG
jgi:hypothetical protein